MSTKTQTTTTHYHIQKKRRAEFIEEWRKYRQTVIREEDVTLVPDGARPSHRRLHGLGRRSSHPLPRRAGARGRSRNDDAPSIAIRGTRSCSWSTAAAGPRSTASATTGRRGTRSIIPAWSWHRHGNDGDRPGRFMSYSSEPTLWTLGMSLIEDAGHEPFAKLPPRPKFSGGIAGRRSVRAPPAPRRAGDEEAPLGPHPHAVRRAGDPGHAARHAHQVPQRPRHRQPGLGPHAGDDPVRAGQDAVAAPPSGRGVALRGRGLRPQLHGHRARQRASTTAGRRATSSSSTTSCGTSTSTTTRSTSAGWCASTCSIRCSRRCAR